jgi:hypothetical protein
MTGKRAVWEGVEGELLGGVAGGDGVAVGVQDGRDSGWCAGDLAESQAALLVEEADLAVGLVVDHWDSSLIMARRMGLVFIV